MAPTATDVRITYDSEYAARVAQSTWQATRNLSLVGNLRDAFTQASAVHSIVWRWVRGHSNHYFNELADVAAKAAVDFNQLTTQVIDLPPEILSSLQHSAPDYVP